VLRKQRAGSIPAPGTKRINKYGHKSHIYRIWRGRLQKAQRAYWQVQRLIERADQDKRQQAEARLTAPNRRDA
jgi:hypothetical protein